MELTYPDCLYCPACNSSYSQSLQPRNLRNCQHTMCQKCIRKQNCCPLDSTKVDFRKFTLRGFQINKQILDAIKQQSDNQSNNQFINVLQQPIQSRISKTTTKTTKTVIKKKQKSVSQPNKDVEMCLLHSKIADIICSDDGCLICSNCALFGQHKGHNIQKLPDFIQKLANLTDSTLSIFTQIKAKQQDLNKLIVQNYIKDTLSQHKTQAIKNIKAYFNKVVDIVRKAQKNALASLEIQIKNKRQELKKQMGNSLKNIQSKANQWFKQVQNLGIIMQNVYSMKNVEAGIKYFDQSQQQSFIAKNGQYLKVQYNSTQNMIKQQIDLQIKKTSPLFNQQVFEEINKFCVFSGEKVNKTGNSQYKINIGLEQVTPLTFKTLQHKKSENDEDNLLEGGQNSRIINSFDFKEFENMNCSSNHQQLQLPKIPQVQFTKSPCGTKNVCLTNRESQRSSKNAKRISQSRTKKLDFSNSYKQQRGNSRAKSRQRQALGVLNDNKKKKKIQIPQKYKGVFQDLKNNAAEIIDFGGAQLGDKNIKQICDYISKSTKVKSLKLVRNKITDEIFHLLIHCCIQGGIASLNLGQNSLSQRSLEYLQTIQLGDLKNITLSLNRINRRNVKQKLDELYRRGIIISI